MHTLETHQKRREVLLADIAAALEKDERFVAAWLTGSYGRGRADALSDIDLTVVVADAFAGSLCLRAEMVTAHPPAARLRFLSHFGDVGNVHENNFNAPEGGTFTSILYRPSGHIVDWVLAPCETAVRPEAARILFEHRPVPVALPEPAMEAAPFAERVAERVAFFWMMTAITVKYLIRGDLPFVCCQVDALRTQVREVECLLAGRPWDYHREPVRQQSEEVTRDELKTTLNTLCLAMVSRMQIAGERGIALRPAPVESIDMLLSLA